MTQTNEERADFSIGLKNWLWGGLCALVAAGLMMLRNGGGRGGFLAAALGAAIATYVMAALVAWIAWRLGGRKPNGGRVAFAVMCGLAMFGQFSVFGDLAGENDAIRALREPMQRFNSKLLQASADPAFASGDVASKLREFDAMIADGSLPPGAHKAPSIISAFRKQLHSNAEHELAYAGSLGDFRKADVLNLTSMQLGDDLKRRRLACKALIDASTDYESWVNGQIDGFKLRIAEMHVSPRLQQQLLEGANRTHAERLQIVGPLLKLRKDYAAALIEMFDYLGEQGEGWSVDTDGKIVFKTDAALEGFQTRARKVDSMNEAMAKLESTNGSDSSTRPDK